MHENKITTLQAVRTTFTVVALSHVLLLLLPSTTKTAESATLHPECPDNCGGISIPYPFGIGANCSMSEYFNISCNKTDNGTSTPYIRDLKFFNINLSLGQARVESTISFQCYNITIKGVYPGIDWWWNLSETPYRYNHELNKFVVIGCDTLAYLNFSNGLYSYLGGCVSKCGNVESLTNGSCSGIGCCQISIPEGTNKISVYFDERYNNSEVYGFDPCGYAMLTEDETFTFNTNYITTDQLLLQNTSAIIDWAIGNTTCDIAKADNSSYACRSAKSVCLNSSSGLGYLCNCSDGYQGNPYLEGGCQDINECAEQKPCSKPGKCHNTEGGYHCSCPFGWRKESNYACELNLALILGTCASIVALSFLALGIYVVLARRKLSKMMEKYFEQHGGWILLEKIKSSQGLGFTIFTKQQVEKATNNFDSPIFSAMEVMERSTKEQ
ncbi:hypothetical protein LUZ61_014407 [Rhynchospora tenuis]|uniref:EGF-like domain-containing protein n=1 Tax=Rhynchospora tenuis TaxID=198213 RepID=A0AAD5WCD1_9POAL|nr:hypothetical protein LUZ61_014407 [Rhynchospora tenuis]